MKEKLDIIRKILRTRDDDGQHLGSAIIIGCTLNLILTLSRLM